MSGPSTPARHARPQRPRPRRGGSPSRRTASPTRSSRRWPSGWNRALDQSMLADYVAAVLRRPAPAVEHAVRRDPRTPHRQGVPAGVLPARARRPGARRDDRGVARRQRGRPAGAAPAGPREARRRSDAPWWPSSATRSVLERLNALAAHLVPDRAARAVADAGRGAAAHRRHHPGRRARPVRRATASSTATSARPTRGTRTGSPCSALSAGCWPTRPGTATSDTRSASRRPRRSSRAR